MTETELIQQATVGDPLAMRRLYERYAPRVFAVVRRMAGDDDLAQDYAQDAWMRAFRALPSFRGDARFSTWIHRIAVNSALQAMRQGHRRDGREEMLSDSIPQKTISGDTLLERRLEEAMDRLPQGMREILVLHDVEGYTHEEIGKALGIAPGTSKSQLSKARVRMRGFLTGSVRTHRENHTGGELP
ncbi:MAG: RNA polymerase sigma factor [Gemmatimonadota bacterium]